MKSIYKVTDKILLLILIVIGAIAFEKGSAVSSNYAGGKPIFSVDKQEKEVAITFDINWAENEYIYDILDVLKKYDVDATFFIMGKWVNYTEENRSKLSDIHNAGHEIGNHSYVHPSFSKISESRIEEELRKTDEIIYEAIGIKPTLFRFPSGDYNENALRFVEDKGYVPIQWDCDSVDWKQSGQEIEYERIMKKIKPGSILLFHNNAKYTPANLNKLIPKLIEDGYKFATISQLIYNENYYVDEEGVQRKNNY